MDFNKFFQSKSFKITSWVIIGLIVILLIFRAGTLVGFRKANFSYKWGENYHRNFAGPRGGFFKEFNDKDFIEANGIFGQIIKIDGPTLVIKGRNNVEEIVIVKDNTAIKHFTETIKLTDLKVNDYIVVIGEPNNAGQIEAKLIRILPPSPPPLPPKDLSTRRPPPPIWR